MITGVQEVTKDFFSFGAVSELHDDRWMCAVLVGQPKFFLLVLSYAAQICNISRQVYETRYWKIFFAFFPSFPT